MGRTEGGGEAVTTCPTCSAPPPHTPLAWQRAGCLGRRLGRTRPGCAASHSCRTQTGWQRPGAGGGAGGVARRVGVGVRVPVRSAAGPRWPPHASDTTLHCITPTPNHATTSTYTHLIKLVGGPEGDGPLPQPAEHAPRGHLPPALVLRGAVGWRRAGRARCSGCSGVAGTGGASSRPLRLLVQGADHRSHRGHRQAQAHCTQKAARAARACAPGPAAAPAQRGWRAP